MVINNDQPSASKIYSAYEKLKEAVGIGTRLFTNLIWIVICLVYLA